MMTGEELLAEQKLFYLAGSTRYPDARLAAVHCLTDTLQQTRPMLDGILRSVCRSDSEVREQIGTVLGAGEAWQRDLLRLLRGSWKEEGGKPRPLGNALLLIAPSSTFAEAVLALFAALVSGDTVVLNVERMRGGAADLLKLAAEDTFEERYVAIPRIRAVELKELPFRLIHDTAGRTAEDYTGKNGLRLFSAFGGEETAPDAPAEPAG